MDVPIRTHDISYMGIQTTGELSLMTQSDGHRGCLTPPPPCKHLSPMPVPAPQREALIQRRIVWLVVFTSYIVYAVLANVIGPALPSISEEFSLAPEYAGLLASMYGVGGVVAIVGGILSDVMGRAYIVFVSLLVISLGAVGVGASQQLLMLASSLLIMGMAAGFLESSSNALIADLFSDIRGAAVNALHVAWNIGSAIGPPIAAIVIAITASWRAVYLLPVPFALAVAFSMFTIHKKIPERRVSPLIDMKRLLGELLRVLPVATISLFILALELGVSFWLPSILMGLKASLIDGGIAVGLFWGLMGVGRLVFGPVADRLGFRKVMILTSLASLMTLGIAALQLPIPLKIALYASTGFFVGPLYPTNIAWINAINPMVGGSLTGLLYVFGTIGIFLSSVLIGFLISLVGLVAAQFLFPILAGIIVVNTIAASLVITQRLPTNR